MTFKIHFSGSAEDLRMALIAEIDRRLGANLERRRTQVQIAEHSALESIRSFLADLVISEPGRK